MVLTFLGTRGEIEARSRRHRRHSSLLLTYLDRKVMIDCGEDWAGQLEDIGAHAIVITHAHPDHAWGLREGSPCPVYATREAWDAMNDYPIDERETVSRREPLHIEGMTFEAFGVEHSTRAPAVGYRIRAGEVDIFYVPDVVYIEGRGEALRGTELYVGDGVTMSRSMVRKRGERLIGHTPVRTQLTWCQKEGIPEAVFTHCGSGVVKGDERVLGAQVRSWARERGVEARIAYDGLEMVLR
ncbi:MAG: MBL fold metallo-hydrolase [Actinobacteria bacterium]|nr:MBL fold metallo-hydrolase [Actinomycetota bacterium]